MTAPSNEQAAKLHEKLRRQLDVWRRELLAIDRRQRLLYFKHTRSASLELHQPDVAALLRSLDRGPLGIRATSDEPARSTAEFVIENKTEKDLPTSLRRLDQTSQQTFADRGFWTLYLGVGMLQWIDPDDRSTIVSPFLLVPVRLQRAGTHRPYTVSRTEDEVVVNPSLLLKLEHDFGLKLPDVDTYEVDVEKLLTGLRKLCAGRDGWAVLDRAIMTTFSFHKEAIYRDLTDHEETILANPLVQLIGLGPDAPSAAEFGFDPVEDEQLDEAVPPETLVSILDADGSQRKCILAARDGRSFVMDGPPGTGKSQTIANIIVELIATGRTVLFVSEKAAALDVVRNRLTDAGLEQFLLELHSHAATRKHVVQELDRALSQQLSAKRSFTQTDEARLVAARRQLSGYAAAVNETRPALGRSLHDVLGRLAQLRDYDRYTLPSHEQWAALDSARIADLLETAGSLERAWRPAVEGEAFLWRQLAESKVHAGGAARALRAAREVTESTATLIDRARAVDDDLGLPAGLSIDAIRRRVDLLRHLEVPRTAPVHWLSLQDLDRVTARIAELTALSIEYQQVVAQLAYAADSRWAELDGGRAEDFHALSTAAWAPPGDTSASDLLPIVEFLRTAPDSLSAIVDDAARLAALFGMPAARVSIARAGELAALAELGARPTQPEPAWLNATVQNALTESARVLSELVTVVCERESAVKETFTREALDVDLGALATRFREEHKGFRRLFGQARADRKLLRSVTVTHKVNKTVLARLEEAAAWQQAEQALTRGERDHAHRLGGYYHRTETDFDRVTAALKTAQEAVRLAGEDLNATALATQVSVTASPDPALTLVGSRLAAAVQAWTEESRRRLGAAASDLLRQPVLEVDQWCRSALAALEPAWSAVDHAATVARQDLTIAEGAELLQAAKTARVIQSQTVERWEDDLRELGPSYNGTETDWKAVSDAVEWAETLRSMTGGAVPPPVAERLHRPALRAADLVPAVEEWTKARDRLCSFFASDRAAQLRSDLDDDLSAALDLAEDMALAATADIDEWRAYARASEMLRDAGLDEVLLTLQKDRAPAGAVMPATERAVLAAWADATIRVDSRLAPYRSVDRDALVEEFRRLDQALVQESHATVVNACSSRRPKSLTSRAAQIIRREAQKKTRHMAVREVLTEAGTVAQELKPCFMMSPLSVSQFLPSEITFDVVIFDEASQVLPSDAINCIYRGSQLIVAGDQKQLPPTSFFARTVDEDTTEETEDLDVFQSVLDLCKAAGAMPSLPLTWHYRSKHESLITYSNYRFYDGALNTFPGAAFEAPDLGLSSILVDGVYRRGGGRDNAVEAATVVDRIVFHRQQHPELSLGVVTFSSAQEDAILAAVEQRSGTESALSGILNEHDRLDGFFVKSLENVQGDERDIILFSIGYGPDEVGKFTLNFGPLNRDGGWRRLNVAITRARRRVEVIHSFAAAKIGETKADGVRHLRGYLDFAERGMAALAQDLEESQGDAESPFEEDVLRTIRSWGYDAVPQVGSAGYRIDMAVRHPELPGKYVLAVECDGAAYHSSKAARDRDRLREQVLRGLGWEVHRIWGISWVRDRDGQMARLRKAIEDAICGTSAASVPATPIRRGSELVIEEVDFDAPPSWAQRYERATVRVRCRHEPQSIDALPDLRAYVEQVLAVEAPTHEETLLRSIRADWGIGRIGALIKANVHRALDAAIVNGRHVETDAAGFHRIAGRALVAVRAPADEDTVRKVAHIPPEELDLAVEHVVNDAISADEADVSVVVSRVFGWRRQGADIQAAIRSSLSRLEAAGRLNRDSGSGRYSVP